MSNHCPDHAERADKPLGMPSYGRIGHLPGSRMGRADRCVPQGQARICTERVRDWHDRVIVQEKLDGSCVAVARLLDGHGTIIALGRKGYPARSSPYAQHQLWADWVDAHCAQFDFLLPGQRLVGEWLAQAHGTRYALRHDPFVAFDLMRGHLRTPHDDFLEFVLPHGLVVPHTVHVGGSLPIEEAMRLIAAQSPHGAVDPIEGAVWRVERHGGVDFLAKWLRPDKEDGCYLPEITGKPPVWNWFPSGRAGDKGELT